MARAAAACAAPAPHRAGPRTGTAGTGPRAEAAAHPEHGAGSGSVPPQGVSPVPGRSEPRHAPRHPSLRAGGAAILLGPGRAGPPQGHGSGSRPAAPSGPLPARPTRAPLRTGSRSPALPPQPDTTGGALPARPRTYRGHPRGCSHGSPGAAPQQAPQARPQRPQPGGARHRHRDEPRPAPPRAARPRQRRAHALRFPPSARGGRAEVAGCGWSPSVPGAALRGTERSR